MYISTPSYLWYQVLKATHKLFDNFNLDQKYEITNVRVGSPWKVTQNIRDNIELGFLIQFREFHLNFFCACYAKRKIHL